MQGTQYATSGAYCVGEHFVDPQCMYTPQMALSCCCFSFSTLCLPVQNNLDYCLAETQLNTQGEDRIHV